ncbi:leucine-rich repeat domain-containing protein [Vagococcus xieshaowenii]|nr:leucine-rich repeat domain-containing protein [Vagococcus xieshaowenii]
MKRTISYSLIASLLLQTAPLSVVANELSTTDDEIKITETDASVIEQTLDSTELLENKTSEETIVSEEIEEVVDYEEKIENSKIEPNLNEPISQSSETELVFENIEDSSEEERVMESNEEGTLETSASEESSHESFEETSEDKEETKEVRSNSETIDGITYSWNWDNSLKTLTFNAGGGTSENVLEIIQDKGMLDVQHLTFQNLPEIATSFSSLEQLVSLTFTNNTLLSGTKSFYGLKKLTEVKGDIQLTLGSDYLFAECSALEMFVPSLKLSSDSKNKQRGSFVFKKTKIRELALAANHGISISKNSFSDGHIFAEMPNLERFNGFNMLNFSSSGTDHANASMSDQFEGSTNLKEIHFSGHAGVSNIPTINDNFFDGYTNLEKIEILNGSTNSFYLNFEAFRAIPNLRELRLDIQQEAIYNSSVTQYVPNLEVFSSNSLLELGSNMFENHNNLQEINLANTTKIGDLTFASTTNLQVITAPKLQELGTATFKSAGVKKVNFPELITMEDQVFAETNELTEVKLNKLSSLGSNAFYKSRVEKVSIPEVTELPSKSFEKCTRLIEVLMPKVEVIGSNSFSDTKSLKKLNIPEVWHIKSFSFFNSGVEHLDFPKLTNIDNVAFQCAFNLKSLNLPVVKTIQNVDSMFHMTGAPYEMEISMPMIHGIDTSVLNKSSIELIKTTKESQEVIKPLLEDKNDRIIAVITDGIEYLDSEDKIELEVGDSLSIPVVSDIIINENYSDVKADVAYVWHHDEAPVTFGDELQINKVMPWHTGTYYRSLNIHHSEAKDELFHNKTNSVQIDVVNYTNELEVGVEVGQPEITIGETTNVTTTIENVTGYGDVKVNVDLVNGLLGGIELVEGSIKVKINNQIVLTDASSIGELTIPKDDSLTIDYQVIGINNESIENNIEVILHEVGKETSEEHIWAGANRIKVKNGVLKFTSNPPEVIEFKSWGGIDNPLTLGSITEQASHFELKIEDLRGSNNFAQNEIKGNRSAWRVEVSTDNNFIDKDNKTDSGLQQLLGKTADGTWHNAKDGVTLHKHIPIREMPLSSKDQVVTIGEEQKLGIMLNQITGLKENSDYQVEMEFNLIDAP